MCEIQINILARKFPFRLLGWFLIYFFANSFRIVEVEI